MSIRFFEQTIAILTTASDTNGVLGAVEVAGPGGAVPPLHVHRREDETFYVGRAGVRDDAGDVLVYSWKARFVQGLASATAHDPGDVPRQRRYHVQPVNTITETSDTVFAELARRI